MTITDINSPGAVYPNIQITSQAAQEYINANGGIQGRPLEAEFCDSQGTADGAAACARQAVSDGVTAVVGSFNFSPDAMVEVLEAANIPYFGECCALGAKENTSKNAFPFGSIQMYGVGEVKKAVEDGCKNIKAMIIEGAESFWPPMQEAAKRLGAADKLNPKYVTQPGTVQDQSAQVAELLDGGTDCVVSVTSETPLTAFMVAWDAAQPKAKFYGPQGNLNKISAKGHEKILEGATVVGMYPDISCPAWDSYRATLEKISADPSQDYNSLGGLGTWAAYMGFKQIADKMTGTIDGPSFKEAASAATVDLPGMIPTLDLTKEWTAYPGLLRSFNRSVVYSQITNGDVAPLGDCGTFDDVASLVEGTS
jgi:ABC-type branched-subunit amino acid transport system substrate-binding protein